MTTISFEIDPLEVPALTIVLKKFNAKKIRIKESEDAVKMTKAEFSKMLDESKKGKGAVLKSKKEIDNFFASL